MLNRMSAVILLVLASATTALASTAQPIPEPSIMALLATGAGGTLLWARSRRSKK